MICETIKFQGVKLSWFFSGHSGVKFCGSQVYKLFMKYNSAILIAKVKAKVLSTGKVISRQYSITR